MPIDRKKVEARLEREEHGDSTFDVLYIDDKEIASFHLQNIESLKLVHTNASILEFVTDYLNKGQQ
jgi:hypothetical protein